MILTKTLLKRLKKIGVITSTSTKIEGMKQLLTPSVIQGVH